MMEKTSYTTEDYFNTLSKLRSSLNQAIFEYLLQKKLNKLEEGEIDNFAAWFEQETNLELELPREKLVNYLFRDKSRIWNMLLNLDIIN